MICAEMICKWCLARIRPNGVGDWLDQSDDPELCPRNLSQKKHEPRKRPLFVAIGVNVMAGHQKWAVARSHTFARRIAAALNKHKPESRGY
jgi:predicted helicase